MDKEQLRLFSRLTYDLNLSHRGDSSWEVVRGESEEKEEERMEEKGRLERITYGSDVIRKRKEVEKMWREDKETRVVETAKIYKGWKNMEFCLPEEYG